MEAWVHRALERRPNVPALYGWLALDRRGRWRIRGEVITRPQIIDTMNANYAADDRGCWFFQNGPQRGYMSLEAAPLILDVDGNGQRLVTHTGRAVEQAGTAYLDEEGSLLLLTEHGPGQLADSALDWALARLKAAGAAPDAALEASQLEQALARRSDETTGLVLRYGDQNLPVHRLDAADAPARLGFVRDPQPPG